MKKSTFERITVAVLSIVLICVVAYSIDAHIDRMEAKAEVETYNVYDRAIEAGNEFNDALVDFLMSDECQAWASIYEGSY